MILIHKALPEIDFSEIDIRTKFLGKEIGAPMMISAITGGFKGAEKVNDYLANLAERYRIPMGVGSQRAALEKRSLRRTYSVIKKHEIPLKVANIGAPQVLELKKKEIEDLLDMIEADALAIHLNYLQEVVQPEGDLRARGVLAKISEICKEIGVPVIVKETGAGISGEVAKELYEAGVKAIDVAGYGGTSFLKIERERAKRLSDSLREKVASSLTSWGIPSPISLLEVRRELGDRVEIVASGGIRNGHDVVRALCIGADVAGMARRPLEAYFKGETLDDVIFGIKAVMFLLGAKNPKELRGKRYIFLGKLREWAESLGL